MAQFKIDQLIQLKLYFKRIPFWERLFPTNTYTLKILDILNVLGIRLVNIQVTISLNYGRIILNNLPKFN